LERLGRTVGAALLVAVALSGCQVHHLAASKCATSIKAAEVQEVQQGAIAIEKVGLTPNALKVEQACR
jgi:outer membrane lipoprotein SlyB